MANPVAGYEETTELGAGVFIFTEFRGIFETNGVKSYEQVENSAVHCIMRAYNILKLDSSLSRVDLFAKILTSVEAENDEEHAGSLFIEIYLLQKVSNGVCESFGKIGNLYRDGVRRKMGILFLEANLRLHFVSPLEKAYKFFEYVRMMWINCMNLRAVTEARRKKRRSRAETVTPIGNEAVFNFKKSG